MNTDNIVFPNSLIKDKIFIIGDTQVMPDKDSAELYKVQTNVKFTIYTASVSKELNLYLTKYNQQYQKVDIKEFSLFHDKFLIIDETEVYHFGTSLKDLGKKWFAVSKMDINSLELVKKL